MTPRRSSALDGRPARLVALLVFLGCVGTFFWLYGDSLRPEHDPAPIPDSAQSSPATTNAAPDPAFAQCFAERAQQIDQMHADGMIEPAQRDLFKTRAEAMCRAQADG